MYLSISLSIQSPSIVIICYNILNLIQTFRIIIVGISQIASPYVSIGEKPQLVIVIFIYLLEFVKEVMED